MLPEETKEAIRKEIAGMVGAFVLLGLVFLAGLAIGWLVGRFL